MGFPLNHGLIECDDRSRPKLGLEVAGAFDAFVSLEEIAPDADWVDVLAESWGLPSPSPEVLEQVSLLTR